VQLEEGRGPASEREDRYRGQARRKMKSPRGRGAAALLKKRGLGLGFFCIFFFLMFPKLSPPLKIQCSMVFIGKVLLGFQISPSTFPFLLFSSFFCKF
jgi:hypothetical protein